MISSLNSTISALQAFRTKMDVTADNIANVNTEGFKKSKATFEEGAHGDVRVEINRVDTPGYGYQGFKADQVVEKESSNVKLEEEIPSMIVTQNAYEANLKTLQTQDSMLGSLLDIIG